MRSVFVFFSFRKTGLYENLTSVLFTPDYENSVSLGTNITSFSPYTVPKNGMILGWMEASSWENNVVDIHVNNVTYFSMSADSANYRIPFSIPVAKDDVLKASIQSNAKIDSMRFVPYKSTLSP